MSHTPRTDAMIQPIPGKDCVTGSPIEVVHADDCRKLERELAALKRKYSAEPQADTPQNLEAQRAVGTTPSGDTPEGRQLAADSRPAAAALNSMIPPIKSHPKCQECQCYPECRNDCPDYLACVRRLPVYAERVFGLDIDAADKNGPLPPTGDTRRE